MTVPGHSCCPATAVADWSLRKSFTIGIGCLPRPGSLIPLNVDIALSSLASRRVAYPSS
ncbi:MAG TPA: hypothetical protein VGZ25_16600 [Gemmataceae bacterium]|nr:hypothetical protein [Gemmataceae bacterium]